MTRRLLGPIILNGEYTPKTPAIYQIRNVRNNKIYIGSCLSITKRLGVHNTNLRKGRASPYLQKEYLKYFDSFEMRVLEHCTVDNIVQREQYWLDQYYDNQNECYNINPTAYSNLGLKLSEQTKQKLSNSKKKLSVDLIDPNGKFVSVVNLRKFCIENNIFYSHLLQLRKGKVKTCKGWRLAINKDIPYIPAKDLLAQKLQKVYDVRVVCPNNKEYGPITNLRAFCREHGINDKNFRSMINGYAKICQGWRLLENKHITKDSIKTDRISKISNTYDVRIQSPTNKVFGPISNLNQFCKEHGLSQSSMHDLIKGKMNQIYTYNT